MQYQAFSTTCTAALEYASRGWHVLPAPMGSKKSFKSAEHSNGRKWGATTDLHEIRSDWMHWPQANIGIATGPKSGFFVIDADTMEGHGKDGLGTLNRWIAEHGEVPHTVEATTPSGGWHLYFRYPVDLRVQTNSDKLAPGVDVRGDGGMVIAAPSVRPDGSAYVWKNPPGQFELAECPDWLMDKITAAQAPKLSGRAMPRVDDRTPAGLEELAELLTNIDPDASGYDQWFRVLMAVHDHSGGSGEGLALADQWSARGAMYRPGEVAQKWLTIAPGGGVGIGTIATIARQNGADLSEIARRHRSNIAHPIVKALTAATSDGMPCSNTLDEIDLSHDALATDMGAKGWDADAKYVSTWGKWLFWTGTHWQADDLLSHLTRTRAYLRQRARDLTALAESKVKTGTTGDRLKARANDQARTLRHKNTVAAVESLARSNPVSVARPIDFDANKMLLGTPGGVVDLRTGQLRQAQRGNMITKQTTVAPAPPGTVPVMWIRFLNEIFAGDADIISFMQRAAGYALTGMTTEHKFLFLYGTGRNGKSVFLNTLFNLWGDYARRASSSTFLNSQTERHPTDLAGLQGARLVAGSELPKGKTWDESIIKDLTGGDKMTARFMRGDFFDFDPQLTLMIAGNNMPSFRGVDEAIRARVVLVPFTVTIPPDQRDKDLPDKLKAEAPAILRWAIDGTLQWQLRGLDVPASVAAASAEYFDDEDIVGQFLADETIREAGAFTSASDLHQRYSQWAARQGLGEWTQRTVVKEIRQRDFFDGKSNGQRGLRGIKLNSATER